MGQAGNKPLLSIDRLEVDFRSAGRAASDPKPVCALRGIDLSIGEGEICGLVGESGSGKTVTATAVMGLLPPKARVSSGRILFRGSDLLSLSPSERRAVRGRQIAMIFQEPARFLNPSFRISTQIAETLQLHLGMRKAQALERAAELAELVGLRGKRRVLRSYPHELSGGMKQRAMIAMAISCNPSLLIADEPTTALDVTLQAQILNLILRLRDGLKMAVLFISHDLRLVRAISDTVAVIYAGRIVESAPRDRLFDRPLHPYTRLLMQSVPSADRRGARLQAIPGRVPDGRAIPSGCAFHPRCPIAEEACSRLDPQSLERAPSHAAACHLVGKPWPV